MHNYLKISWGACPKTPPPPHTHTHLVKGLFRSPSGADGAISVQHLAFSATFTHILLARTLHYSFEPSR